MCQSRAGIAAWDGSSCGPWSSFGLGQGRRWGQTRWPRGRAQKTRASSSRKGLLDSSQAWARFEPQPILSWAGELWTSNLGSLLFETLGRCGQGGRRCGDQGMGGQGSEGYTPRLGDGQEVSLKVPSSIQGGHLGYVQRGSEGQVPTACSHDAGSLHPDAMGRWNQACGLLGP